MRLCVRGIRDTEMCRGMYNEIAMRVDARIGILHSLGGSHNPSHDVNSREMYGKKTIRERVPALATKGG
jgi:hypothetical protein